MTAPVAYPACRRICARVGCSGDSPRARKTSPRVRRRDRPVQAQGAFGVVAGAVGGGEPAREQGRVGGQGPAGGSDGVLVEDRLARQPVEVGARVPAVPVAGEVVGPGRVEGDEDDGGPRAPAGASAQKQGRRQAGGEAAVEAAPEHVAAASGPGGAPAGSRLSPLGRPPVREGQQRASDAGSTRLSRRASIGPRRSRFPRGQRRLSPGRRRPYATASLRRSRHPEEPARPPLPLAIHSGDPLIADPFPGWPIQDGTELRQVQAALESGTWGVGGECLAEFSRRFAGFQQAGPRPARGQRHRRHRDRPGGPGAGPRRRGHRPRLHLRRHRHRADAAWGSGRCWPTCGPTPSPSIPRPWRRRSPAAPAPSSPSISAAPVRHGGHPPSGRPLRAGRGRGLRPRPRRPPERPLRRRLRRGRHLQLPVQQDPVLRRGRRRGDPVGAAAGEDAGDPQRRPPRQRGRLQPLHPRQQLPPLGAAGGPCSWPR